MTPHTKKLIGAVIMLAWLFVYVLLASGFAVRILPSANEFVRFLYYLVAGTLWIVPIGLLLPWMYREPKPKS
jgi:hypothetical protein